MELRRALIFTSTIALALNLRQLSTPIKVQIIRVMAGETALAMLVSDRMEHLFKL